MIGDGGSAKSHCGAYWDYGPGGFVVEVDEEGAGRLECAWPPGDQLRHIGICPLSGPCLDPE